MRRLGSSMSSRLGALFAALAFIVSLVSTADAQSPSPVITPVTPAPVSGVTSEMGVFVQDTDFLLRGGAFSGAFFWPNATGVPGLRYDPALDAWDATNVAPAPLAYPHVTVTDGRNVYVYYAWIDSSSASGTRYYITYMRRGYRYDPETNTWAQTYAWSHFVGEGSALPVTEAYAQGRPAVLGQEMYWCFADRDRYYDPDPNMRRYLYGSATVDCQRTNLATSRVEGLTPMPGFVRGGVQVWLQDPANSDRLLVFFRGIAPLRSYSLSQDRWDTHSTLCRGGELGTPVSVNTWNGSLYAFCSQPSALPAPLLRVQRWNASTGVWDNVTSYPLTDVPVSHEMVAVPGHGLLHLDGTSNAAGQFVFNPDGSDGGFQPEPSLAPRGRATAIASPPASGATSNAAALVQGTSVVGWPSSGGGLSYDLTANEWSTLPQAPNSRDRLVASDGTDVYLTYRWLRVQPSSSAPAYALYYENNETYRFDTATGTWSTVQDTETYRGTRLGFFDFDLTPQGTPLVRNGEMLFCLARVNLSPGGNSYADPTTYPQCTATDLAMGTSRAIAAIPYLAAGQPQVWLQDPQNADRVLVQMGANGLNVFTYSISGDAWTGRSLLCDGGRLGMPVSLNAWAGRVYAFCKRYLDSPESPVRVQEWSGSGWTYVHDYPSSGPRVSRQMLTLPGHGLLHLDGRTQGTGAFIYYPGTGAPSGSGEVDPWRATLASLSPRIVRTSPAAAAWDVSTATPIEITFDRALDPATVTTGHLLLREGFLLSALPTTLAFDAATNTVTITPASPLEVGTRQMVTVARGVKSAEGVPMTADYTFSFVTAGSRALLVPDDPRAQPLYDQYGSLVNAATTVSGVLAALSFVWGGYTYTTSAGDVSRATQGRNAMLGALSGLLLVMTARVIVAVVAAGAPAITP